MGLMTLIAWVSEDAITLSKKILSVPIIILAFIFGTLVPALFYSAGIFAIVNQFIQIASHPMVYIVIGGLLCFWFAAPSGETSLLAVIVSVASYILYMTIFKTFGHSISNIGFAIIDWILAILIPIFIIGLIIAFITWIVSKFRDSSKKAISEIEEQYEMSINGRQVMKKCPYCAEEINEDATKCKYCGSILDESRVAEDEKKKSLGCPHCGLLSSPDEAMKCKYCGKIMDKSKSLKKETKAKEKLYAVEQTDKLLLRLTIAAILLRDVAALVLSYYLEDEKKLSSNTIKLFYDGVFLSFLSVGKNWARILLKIKYIIAFITFIVLYYFFIENYFLGTIDLVLIFCIILLLFATKFSKKTKYVFATYCIALVALLSLQTSYVYEDYKGKQIITEIDSPTEMKSAFHYVVKLPSDDWKFIPKEKAKELRFFKVLSG